jgi:hypothetical protein
LIELSRALARQFRAVLRRSVLAAEPRGPAPVVLCRASRQGLTLSCRQGDVALRHHTSGSFRASAVALPLSVLAQIEGGAGTVVALEQTAPLKARASWQDEQGPHALDFDTPDPTTLPAASEPAGNAVTVEAGLLQALDEAAHTASRDRARFACNRILLRGKDGAVIGTDGRQLLVHRGFPLPWPDDLLLPALPVFGCRELPQDVGIRLGLVDNTVTLEVGPWLLALQTDRTGRFPDIDKVIPAAGAGMTRLLLAAEDVKVLLQALPHLPAQDEPYRPVTVDLTGTISVRARGAKGPVEEVALPRSHWEGPALQVVMDRRYLQRALKLCFTEVHISTANDRAS